MPTATATKHWRARFDGPIDPRAVASLRQSTGLPEPFCRLLVARGHAGADDARSFLKPTLSGLLDPYGLRDLDRAVERIDAAVRGGQTILVHGDYDVDGVCGAALFTRVLRRLGARVWPFVPNRFEHGYDLGEGGLRTAARAGAKLLLTADCGTLALEPVRQARAAGIDVVVTDHHTPGPTLPDAVAIVNPGRADCDYPTRGLCGTGVAFKVCEALWRAHGLPREELFWHLDLVALATVADLVPLTGENRVLTRFGLRVIRQTRNPGIAALIGSAGLDGARIGAGQLSHVLGPRINAAGRVSDARSALEMLVTEDVTRAHELAGELERQNVERRDIDRRTLREALDALESSGFDPEEQRTVVLAREGWHPGVIGIVASRIVERVHRPTVLIALRDGQQGRGSGRSIRGFDLVGGLRACDALLERYGGHRAAAGLDIRPERVDAFRAAFEAHARAHLGPDDLRPELGYDVELSPRDATPELVRLLRHVGPFGVGNPAPVFLLRGVGLREPARPVGRDGEHARLTLVAEGMTLPGIAFRQADRLCGPDACRGPLDVALQLEEDGYRGGGAIQARVVDVRPAAAAGKEPARAQNAA